MIYNFIFIKNIFIYNYTIYIYIFNTIYFSMYSIMDINKNTKQKQNYVEVNINTCRNLCMNYKYIT